MKINDVTGLGPLFQRCVEPVSPASPISSIRPDYREQLDVHCEISKVGKILSDLEGKTDPQEIAVILKEAGTSLGIAEVDLKKYAANKRFLSGINSCGGYQSVEDGAKLPLLSILGSFGNSCPAIYALNSKQRCSLGRKPLIDFDHEGISQAFRNEYVAAQNRLRQLEHRYKVLK